MKEWFQTLDGALRAWGAWETTPYKRAEAQEAIDEMTHRYGRPRRYYTIHSGAYVGVVFANTKGTALKLYPTYMVCWDQLSDAWKPWDGMNRTNGPSIDPTTHEERTPYQWYSEFIDFPKRTEGDVTHSGGKRECPCNPGFKLGAAQDCCEICGEPVPYTLTR